MRLALFFLKIVIFAVCSNSVASEEARVAHEQMRDKLYNHCDMVFYCATTRIQGSDFDESQLYKNQKFMFSLKGGALIVPKKYSLLGDGTLDYKIYQGGCSEETGKLLDEPFGKPWFKAKMFDGKWVEFSDGKMFGIDASMDSTRYETTIWYAQCESFD